MCRIEDTTRVGQEVLVEGTVKLSGELFVVPSLEVIREDGSLPLTLENQSTSFKEVKLGMVVAKITMLPERRVEDHLDENVNQSLDGGGNPPDLRIWHIPTHVANGNAVGGRHGKEWTSRQLIPEDGAYESVVARPDCKVYFAEEAEEPAELPVESNPAEGQDDVPDFLRCMFPADGTLTPDEVTQMEA